MEEVYNAIQLNKDQNRELISITVLNSVIYQEIKL